MWGIRLNSAWLRTPSARLVGATLALALAPALGCTNNLALQNTLGSGTGTQSNNPFTSGGSGGGGGGSTDTSGQSMLDRVVFSSADPTSSFDLVGIPGLGQIGTSCAPPGSSPADLGSLCHCTYSYSTGGASTETIDVTPSYVEADLLRCPRTDISPLATTANVKIHLVAQGLYSNDIDVNLASAQPTIDLTLPNSYLPVQRYQCREYLFIPYLFSTSADGMYDPFQSDNTRLAYPSNFYSSNMGLAQFARFAVSVTGGGGGGQADF